MKSHLRQKRAKRANNHIKQISRKASTKESSRINPEDLSDMQACLNILDQVSHSNYRIAKEVFEMIRTRSCLWKSFSQGVNQHWAGLIKIIQDFETVEEFGQRIMHPTAERELLRKVETAANTIVQLRVSSCKKLQQLSEKAAQLHQKQQVIDNQRQVGEERLVERD